MQGHSKGRVVILLLCCLMLFGCASDGTLKRWGKCAIAGAGIGGAAGGVIGAANSTAAGPVGAVAGALVGGLICAFIGDKEPQPVTTVPVPEKEDVVIVVEEPPLPAVPVSETLGSVHFASSSAELSPQEQAILKDVAIKAKRLPDLMITLHGHTDNTGRPHYDNEGLAKRRSQSVEAYLESLGVEVNQIKIGSGGVIEENNQTKEGRAENRKVDIIGTI